MKINDWYIFSPRSNKTKSSFSIDEARGVAKVLRLDFNNELFTLEDFQKGMNVELEHGTRDARTNVSNDDPIITGKIALAHLYEFPDYYKRLEKLENEAHEYWKHKKKLP